MHKKIKPIMICSMSFLFVVGMCYPYQNTFASNDMEDNIHQMIEVLGNTNSNSDSYTEEEIPQVKIQTPIASDLEKFLYYPVSMATGVPEINIPLYTLKVGDVNIPFSLSYHASGIKVESSAGLHGYGWSFLPGLRITRSINGKPDEKCFNGILSSISENGGELPLWSRPLSNNGVEWGKDGEYDIFTLYLPNSFCNFILVNNSDKFSVVQINTTPYKITPNFSQQSLTGFTVIDDHNVKYEFSSIVNGPHGPITFALTCIKQPCGDINFSYKQLSLFSLKRYSEISITIRDGYIALGEPGKVIETPIVNMGPFSPEELAPTSITFPNGVIKFDYTPSPSMMSKMVVENNSGDTIVRYNFIQKDHLLDKISSSQGENYSFSYNPNRFESIYGQDFMGYYNGDKFPYGTLVPKFEPYSLNYQQSSETGYNPRTTDEDMMKANILEKINFPTGGFALFEYEANKALDEQKVIKCGLRIKKVTNYDPISKKSEIKEYKYGINESGYGELIFYPRLYEYYIKREVLQLDETGTSICGGGEQIELLPNSVMSDFYQNNCLIWYKLVSEYSSDGVTTEEYSYTPDYYGFLTSQDAYIMEQRHFIVNVPKVTNRKIYKKDKDSKLLVKEDIYNYNLPEYGGEGEITGLVVGPSFLFERISGGNYDSNRLASDYASTGYNNIRPYFDVRKYNIYTGIKQVINHVEKKYDGLKFIQQRDSSIWDGYNIKQVFHESSNKKVIMDKFYYPNNVIPEYDSDSLKILLKNNLLTSLIRKEHYVDNRLCSTDVIKFRQFGNNIVKPYSVTTKNSPFNVPTEVLKFNNYDIYGNILYMTEMNNMRTQYIWGYNNMYPIAEIKNVPYIKMNAYTDDLLTKEIEKLRVSIPNALITSYVYKPLIGITSIIKPNGEKVIYEYDGTGRLKNVKDSMGKVINSYNYYYKHP